MKLKDLSFIVFFILISIDAFSVESENLVIPYTLADRERLIRIEERLSAMDIKFETKFNTLETKYDVKFDSISKQLELTQKQNEFNGNLTIVLITCIFGSVAYMWWDRRSANKPLNDKIEEQ